MNYGPLVFLAAFFAMAASWFGLVLAPQIQIGREQAGIPNSAEIYPLGRPGVARQGLEIYRANGCASCHSQQVGQQGTMCDVVLTDVGLNVMAVMDVLGKTGESLPSAPALAAGLPKAIQQRVTKEQADAVVAALQKAGGKAELRLVSIGPDIDWGWGLRHSVARDFLYDYPVMLGSQRVGPDLANVGVRRDENWLLKHLYAPRADVPGSPMPPYRYLFEKRKIKGQPSPEALQQLPAELAPEKDFEIVPTADARVLVAYLLSLRADAALPEAPMTVVAPPAQAGQTNVPAPAAGQTNTPAQ